MKMGRHEAGFRTNISVTKVQIKNVMLRFAKKTLYNNQFVIPFLKSHYRNIRESFECRVVHMTHKHVVSKP